MKWLKPKPKPKEYITWYKHDGTVERKEIPPKNKKAKMSPAHKFLIKEIFKPKRDKIKKIIGGKNDTETNSKP